MLEDRREPIYNSSTETLCGMEDLPEVMNDRDEW